MEKTLSRDRLIIFGRYPVPGNTKTRLIPVLGPVGAASLQRRLTEKTFLAAKAFDTRHKTTIECCFEGGTPQKIRAWLGTVPRVTFQRAGGLGLRMRAAIFEALNEGCGRVVLVGTDIPEVTAQILEEAFNALVEHDVVLGPSTDGGYWLIGLKRPIDLFENIDWGSPQVLGQTLAQARHQHLTVCLLNFLSDVDTPEDFKSWKAVEHFPHIFLTVVIPTLNEEDQIERSVSSAISPNAEVIVVDGGSTDETVPRAESLGARIISSPLGRSLQQNRGAALARGETLLFLHGDTRLPKGYLTEVFEILMAQGTVLGAFRFRTDFQCPSMRLVERITQLRSKYLQLPYGDQALFMKKATFEKTGGFPPVPIGEDLLLVRQLTKHQNARVMMAKGAAITSDRRWKTLGPLKTTWMNQLMLAGMILGIPLETLARLYKRSGSWIYLT
ncbi:MAG: TIGR04283 family arsenosugar biosynthesis glycosyltransferase [Deltaproteobacteria bacterium]|nr:TIGR04283 family arsenosugar biosynthesis glycosyltransferase [Deltaproteobacteria bacterium]